MKLRLRSYLPFGLVALIVALAGLCAAACTPARDDPFARGHRGTPTPTALPDETPTDVLVRRYDLLTSGETIKIADWDDNRVNLLNFLAGYVIVFGFDHPVELVSVDNGDYGTALLEGNGHLVLQMDSNWHENIGGPAGILDVGAPFENAPNLRIGANPGLREISPGIVEFLGSFVPGDERISDLASQITSGRVGMRPNAAGIKYFKDFQDIWTQWVDESTAQLVEEAVVGRKTALIKQVHTGWWEQQLRTVGKLMTFPDQALNIESSRYRRQVGQLLRDTGLVEIPEKHGKGETMGSYALDLMMSGDTEFIIRL